MNWDIHFLDALRLLFSGFAVLFLPGYVLQRLFFWKNPDLLQSISLSVGLSLSIIPLIAELLFFLPWEPPPYTFLGTFLVLTILFLGFSLGSPFDKRAGRSNLWIGIAGVIAAIGWRFFQVKELVLPAWVDSLHHVLITRKFLDIGGVPENLAPYLPVPFYYHFSFHAVSACFSGLADCPPEQAVFLLGQLLNAMVALSVYRLTIVLLQDKRRALTAALMVAFITQMPAYYATWGRYTLLAGLVLLPLAIAEAQSWIRNRQPGTFLRLALFTAGILLTHYFAAVLLALFLGLWILYVIIGESREPGTHVLSWLEKLASPLLGVLLVTPWLLRMWSYARSYVQWGTSSPGDSIDQLYFPDYLGYLWYLLGPWRMYLLEVVAGIGLAWAWKNGKTRLFALWTTLLFLGVLPWGIRLSPFRPDHFAIVSFLPVSILAAATVWRGRDMVISRMGEKSADKVVYGLLVLMVLLGVWQTSSIINPTTILAEEQDVVALQWIDRKIPRQARFLVNTAPWEWGSFRGTDGGAWILPMTGRWSVAPPPLHAIGNKEYIDYTARTAKQAGQLGACDERFTQFLREEQITHVYLGVKPGNLKKEMLDNCPALVQVYRQGPVRVYAVEQMVLKTN